MIVDRQGRRFRNLRVSLTSACNYACTYCVPNGKRLVAAQDELSAEAMARGVAYLIEAAGIERLRITGGEPLVSPKLETFMRAVGQMGLADISLTTNGQLLARKLPLLVVAGMAAVYLGVPGGLMDGATSTPGKNWLTPPLRPAFPRRYRAQIGLWL